MILMKEDSACGREIRSLTYIKLLMIRFSPEYSSTLINVINATVKNGTWSLIMEMFTVAVIY